MSFSLIFVPPEQRTQPSLAKVYHNVVEEKIRSRIILPSPNLEKKAKSLGRLFDTSVDDPNVLSRVRNRARKAPEKQNDIVDAYTPTERHSLKHIHPNMSWKVSSSKHILPISNTIQTLSSSPGGKFHVPNVPIEYERRLLVSKLLMLSSFALVQFFLCINMSDFIREVPHKVYLTSIHRKCGQARNSMSAPVPRHRNRLITPWLVHLVQIRLAERANQQTRRNSLHPQAVPLWLHCLRTVLALSNLPSPIVLLHLAMW